MGCWESACTQSLDGGYSLESYNLPEEQVPMFDDQSQLTLWYIFLHAGIAPTSNSREIQASGVVEDAGVLSQHFFGSKSKLQEEKDERGSSKSTGRVVHGRWVGSWRGWGVTPYCEGLEDWGDPRGRGVEKAGWPTHRGPRSRQGNAQWEGGVRGEALLFFSNISVLPTQRNKALQCKAPCWIVNGGNLGD